MEHMGSKIESAQKNYTSKGCCKMQAHQLWWVWLLLFCRYCYFHFWANFAFRPWAIYPWLSKNLIDWNQLKKFMQVGIDVKCMHTNFGGHGLSSFGDIATFKYSP